MSAKVCNVLCYKYAWYYMATPQRFTFACMQCLLSISCPFSCTNNTKSFRYFFATFKISYIKSAYFGVCDDYDDNPSEIWMNKYGLTLSGKIWCLW